MNYIWQTQDGFFSTAAMDFVPNPDEYSPLYSDTSDPDNLVLADKAFLRRTLLFYGFPLAPAVMNRLDKIQAIQAEYAPQLTTLQEAYASAQILDNGEAEEIQQEYKQILQEMQEKIQAVPHD